MQTQDSKAFLVAAEKRLRKFRLLLPLRRHFIDSLKLEFIYSDSCQGKPKVFGDLYVWHPIHTVRQPP